MKVGFWYRLDNQTAQSYQIFVRPKEEEVALKNNRNGRHFSFMFPFLQLLYKPSFSLFPISLSRQMCETRRKGKEHPRTIGMRGIRKKKSRTSKKFRAHAFHHVPIPPSLDFLNPLILSLP
ncbi:hypothetical protein DAI22_11g089300 [Oryza sativa Japonica Group]|nr:hypothetical protein DAI22_11g089300 [Oryza sativa Japonica Group]